VKLRSLPIFLAFFVMGFVDSVGALVGYAREQFHLSGTMAGLLPFFGFAAFALVSVPAGVLVDRRGKKVVLGLGLALVLLGELLPVLSAERYALLVPARGVALASLFVAGLAFANIWPLVFSLAIEERPGRAGELSGLMCMAIFGGALLPLLMGRLADLASVRAAFLVPLGGFAYLSFLAFFQPRETAEARP